MSPKEADVECTFLLIGITFVGGEVKEASINVVIGEEFTADIDDILPVNNGTHEIDERRFAAVGPFRRCRQP